MNVIFGRLAEFALVVAGLSFYAASAMNLFANFETVRFLAQVS